jgi:hypothetical protein
MEQQEQKYLLRLGSINPGHSSLIPHLLTYLLHGQSPS